MKEISRIVIPLKGNHVWEYPVCSLCWHGETLIDWVGGGVRYGLDGSCSGTMIRYAYAFDHAVVSPDGHYVALVTRLGTKGLILKDGQIIREVNRSFYHANAYEYPITFLNLPNGQTALVHCPDEYCKLEIEEVESGKGLTNRLSKPRDFFHSRLSVSQDSHYLVSAGWMWHPFDDAWVYDLERIFEQPELLDADPLVNFQLSSIGVPITSAVFAEADLLVIASTDDYYEPEDVEAEGQGLLLPHSVGVYDLSAGTFRTRVKIDEPAGTLMPLGESYAVGFYEHPKLIDLKTGVVLHKWDELNSGKQISSIIWGLKEKLPPLALDPIHKRFAVASEQAITVIRLG